MYKYVFKVKLDELVFGDVHVTVVAKDYSSAIAKLKTLVPADHYSFVVQGINSYKSSGATRRYK